LRESTKGERTDLKTMKYALLNTDKNRFIAPYGSTELWSTYEDAWRECETYGDHVEVRGVTDTDAELNNAVSEEMKRSDPKSSY